MAIAFGGEIREIRGLARQRLHEDQRIARRFPLQPAEERQLDDFAAHREREGHQPAAVAKAGQHARALRAGGGHERGIEGDAGDLGPLDGDLAHGRVEIDGLVANGQNRAGQLVAIVQVNTVQVNSVQVHAV